MKRLLLAAVFAFTCVTITSAQARYQIRAAWCELPDRDLCGKTYGKRKAAKLLMTITLFFGIGTAAASAEKWTIRCGDIEGTMTVQYGPQYKTGKRLDFYAPPEVIDKIKSAYGEGDDFYINDIKCERITYWICPKEESC